jgi:hypothetical protein
LGVIALCVALGVGVFLALGPSNAPEHAISTTIASPPSTSPSTTSPKKAAIPSTSLVPITTTTAPVIAASSPDDVLLEVYNGVGSSDLATTVAQALSHIGFHINGTGDTAVFNYTANVIEYGPGNEAGAEAVALHLSGTNHLVEDDKVPTGDEVIVIVGSSYDGVVGT